MKYLCPTCQEEFPEGTSHCPACNVALMAVQVAEEEPADPMLGALIDGRYRVDSLLGVGGMGSVYKAVQVTMNRPVAIKVLRPELASDGDVVKRFLREAQAVSVLHHANTITVHDFGQSPEGILYIAMEFLDGIPLSDAITRGGPMPVPRALGIIRNVCAALAEAHDKGIIHRDLKPDNVMLLRGADGQDHPKVLDFGIAKLKSTDNETKLTQAGFSVGTPAYMSPEQAQALPEITHHTDIYSLGCILYECLAGRAPFVEDSAVAVLMAHCTTEPAPLSSVRTRDPVPPEVERLVHWMLAKDPAQRPQDARQVVAQVDALLGGPVTSGSYAIPDAAAAPPAMSTGFATGETVAVDSSEVRAVVASETSIPGVSPRGFPVVPAAIGGAIVVVLGIVAAVLTSGGGKASAGKNASVATAKAVATPVGKKAKRVEEKVRTKVKLVSEPSGAWVLEKGKTIGETPLTLEVDPSQTRELKLRLEGYSPALVSLEPGSKDDLQVRLEKKADAAAQPESKRRKRSRRKRASKRSDDDDLPFGDTLK